MLKHNGSGWIEFSVSSDPSATYLIKRLGGPGNTQWEVSRRSTDQGGWTWAKRWGLPVVAIGPVAKDERAMVASITGTDIQGGLQRLWDRILADPSIAVERQGSSLAPDVVEDAVAISHYDGWVRSGRAAAPLFARQVSVASRTSTAARPVMIRVHAAAIANPATVSAGWPIAGP